jgi:hypothetical protein
MSPKKFRKTDAAVIYAAVATKAENSENHWAQFRAQWRFTPMMEKAKLLIPQARRDGRVV